MNEQSSDDRSSDNKSNDSSPDHPEVEQGSDVVAADARSDAEFDAPIAEPEKRPSRFATFTALLALLVAAISLAGIGYLWLFDDEPVVTATNDDQLEELRSALRSAQSTVSGLERDLAELRREAGSSNVDVASIERRLEQRVNRRLDDLETVPARVEGIEETLTTLRGISTGARDAWLRAEAEYYLQIANAQLQLAANPQLATLALTLADERLREVGDPGLIDIRRVVAEEIRSLELLEVPDIESAALTLTSLARVIDSLPVNQEIASDTDAGPATDDNLTGTDRALDSLKRAMSGIVRVRRTDETAKPLIAPEAVYFLRTNLMLQLQAARLALLRGEQALFQQSLDDASAWLREYYDTESTPVRNALATIDDVRSSTVVQTMPDVSESLRLLRDYTAFREAGEQTPPAASNPEPFAAPTPSPSPAAQPEPAPESAPQTAPDPEPETDPQAAPESDPQAAPEPSP